MPAARAGIGGSHQGHPAGEGAAQSRSAHPENPLLQRLTQLIEDGSWEFGELIEKKHASMGQAQFTGPRIGAAAEKPRCGSAVMRCSEWSLPHKACHAAERASNGLQAGELQSL